MKNKEKFSKQLVDVALAGCDIAVNKNTMIPVKCDLLKCEYCIRHCGGICDIGKLKIWAESEYEEQKIDPRLYDAPVDTKILVSNDGIKWTRRHFLKVENNRAYAFNGGMTLFTAEESVYATGWIYAKLYEENEHE